MAIKEVLNPRVMPEDGRIQILPRDIPTGIKQFWNAFNNKESEVAAAIIIAYCQSLGGDVWPAFNNRDLVKFLGWYPERRLDFGKLVNDNYVVLIDGKYRVTTSFVVKCHEYSP